MANDIHRAKDIGTFFCQSELPASLKNLEQRIFLYLLQSMFFYSFFQTELHFLMEDY